MKSVFLLFLVLFIGLSYGREFTIDYDHDTFLMDGQPFQYISGSVHYFRMPRQYWRDRLRKMAAAGLNAVSTYVEWSQHQPEVDISSVNFSGDLNITDFIKIAEEEGLYTILRVGPYICAEREMGGFPYWLLREKPSMRLRVNDEDYKKYLEAWLDVLLPYVNPLLYGNGGPVISVQIENEYGFYGACDHDYTSWLAGVFKRHIGDKAVLFTTDGSDFNSLSCGKIPGVYATVDFGPGTDVTQMQINHRAVEPKGPFVDSEFYPGWLSHWGEGWSRRDTDGVMKTLREILAVKGNVNFYMFYGGTNLGFSAGANSGPYKSDLTSYDYDAPITEAGDLTPKYLAIRDFILDYVGKNTTLPTNTTKGDYGVLQLQQLARMNNSDAMRAVSGRVYTSSSPLTFEAMSQNQGYVLYEAESPVQASGVDLTMDARDRATIYINNKKIGVLSRECEDKSLSVTVAQGDTISILVENLGRINFGGDNNDMKGILSDVHLGETLIQNWVSRGYTLTEDSLQTLVEICSDVSKECNKSGQGPMIYHGTFLSDTDSNISYEGRSLVADTFLDVSGLKKGVVFVNGQNLGRYWSTRGPQYYLYIPGSFMKKAPALNTVVLIEEELESDVLSVPFSTVPIVGEPKY